MARPKIYRHICYNPEVYYFKPRGIPIKELEEVALHAEELEAIRLKDYEKKSQKEASEMLRVSQPTFHRIYTSAREKIAKALIEGHAISIEKRDPAEDACEEKA
ncbi:MAG: DUF134 domain-containing protein [Candidatus Methanofastidiosa archaeon]|jgi:predicted DNA-binding protein (UPF0251 family)|nr:DUF134 domain-containing protein [Candidatus Methanofastidiosa archaeon]